MEVTERFDAVRTHAKTPVDSVCSVGTMFVEHAEDQGGSVW